jgi:hypothetical protein
MRNKTFAQELVLHGMAHTLAGMRMTDPSQWNTTAGAGILHGAQDAPADSRAGRTAHLRLTWS